MNSPDPKWLMRQFGYVPARTTQSALLQTVGLLALGAVCGAAAIALFTPKSGPQLRGDLAAQAQRIRGRVGDKARDLKEKATSMKDHVKQSVKDGGEEVVEELRDGVSGA